MEPVIYTSQGALPFRPSLPPAWKGHVLSGSQPYSFEGQACAIALQKFLDPKFSICYAVADFFQKVKLTWEEGPWLRLQYVLSGVLKYKGDSGRNVKIKAGQYNAIWSPGRHTTGEFTTGRFEMLQLTFKPELVRELLPGFPDTGILPTENKVHWLGEEMAKVRSLLDLVHEGEARRFLYETRIREQLFACLSPLAYQKFDHYDEEKIGRIHAVDHRILDNLEHHYSIAELANIAHMSESELVTMYKDIIGVSMFDRYKEAKLEKARQYLLETKEQVKNLYKIVGYGSYSGFVEAFKKRFGLSPLQYRKKFRPFD